MKRKNKRQKIKLSANEYVVLLNTFSNRTKPDLLDFLLELLKRPMTPDLLSFINAWLKSTRPSGPLTTPQSSISSRSRSLPHASDSAPQETISRKGSLQTATPMQLMGDSKSRFLSIQPTESHSSFSPKTISDGDFSERDSSDSEQSSQAPSVGDLIAEFSDTEQDVVDDQLTAAQVEGLDLRFSPSQGKSKHAGKTRHNELMSSQCSSGEKGASSSRLDPDLINLLPKSKKTRANLSSHADPTKTRKTAGRNQAKLIRTRRTPNTFKSIKDALSKI